MAGMYAIFSLILLVAELFYFKVAERYRIIDKPNERSSHLEPVIRGGGVIFGIGVLLWFGIFTNQYPWLVFGTVAIALISFADDVMTLRALSRFLVHVLAVSLLFYQLDLFAFWPFWLLGIALIVCIGTLNAYNFMDGINGITGVYALVSLATFFFVNQTLTPDTEKSLIIVMLIAVGIFLFFNFRRRARCFAGDVGSVTLAFVQLFLLLQLIVTTSSFGWVLLMLVFGVDSVVTILYRLSRKENIFKAHRTHLYQYLTNELRMPHLVIATAYGIIQLLINIVLVKSKGEVTAFVIGIGLIYVIIYFAVRLAVTNKIRQQRVGA